MLYLFNLVKKKKMFSSKKSGDVDADESIYVVIKHANDIKYLILYWSITKIFFWNNLLDVNPFLTLFSKYTATITRILAFSMCFMIGRTFDNSTSLKLKSENIVKPTFLARASERIPPGRATIRCRSSSVGRDIVIMSLATISLHVIFGCSFLPT